MHLAMVKRGGKHMLLYVLSHLLFVHVKVHKLSASCYATVY
jgi:hypothetical protein